MSNLYDDSGRSELIAAVMRTTRGKVGRQLSLANLVPPGMDPEQAAEIAMMDHLFMVAGDRGGLSAASSLLTAAIDTMHTMSGRGASR